MRSLEHGAPERDIKKGGAAVHARQGQPGHDSVTPHHVPAAAFAVAQFQRGVGARPRQPWWRPVIHGFCAPV